MGRKERPTAEFGERVKNLRKERTAYSQEGFAFYIGMERSQFARIEKGVTDLRYSTIMKIARGLEMTPSELFEGIVAEDVPLYEVKEIQRK